MDSRKGYYERDYATPWGVIRFRVRRTRLRSFLPRLLRAFERRAPEVAELIRQAFLRGIPTRAVGRVVALVTEETVSAQTVSKLTRVLDAQVRAFQEAVLGEEWAYLWCGVHEGAAELRSAARLVVGGPRCAAQRAAATAGLPARAGGEPGGPGRDVAEPVSKGIAGQPSPAHHHGRLYRLGGSVADGLPPSPPPTLLGAQDANTLRFLALILFTSRVN